jgi:hypothetical protein
LKKGIKKSKERSCKMKRNFLSMAVMVISLLALSGFSWGQCPEEPGDLGHCDSIAVEIFDCDHIYDATGDYDSVRVAIYVVHDSNTFWWEGGNKWVQDSIRGITVPFVWGTEGCADSIVFPTYSNWNNKRLQEGHAQMPRSIFRDIQDTHTGEWTYNRLFEMIKDPLYAEPWNSYINFNADTVGISVIPMDPDCQSWGEGPYDPGPPESYGRVLFATLTFLVYMDEDCDSAMVCMDSAFWPPNSKFSLIRYDGIELYTPKHYLPICGWIGPPRIVVTSPDGGESWGVGETHDITWFSDGFSDNVSIEYSTNSGTDWLPIIGDTENDGVHPWMIPNTPSTECRVKVSDVADGDPSDMSNDNFTIAAANEPPVVSDIPDQSIVEGESFDPINLDDYVTDPDNSDDEMTWTYWGNVELLVDITDRVATITVPSPDWDGSETIWFKACDPGGLCDSNEATFTVTEQPDFAIDVAPETLEVRRGESGDYDVILTSINGFASPCTLTVEGHPGGSTATFEDSVLVPTDSTVLTIALSYSVPRDTFPLIITATEIDAGKEITHSDTVILIVTMPTWDFKVVAFPDTQIVVQGNSTTYDVTIIPKVGFTALCTLSVENLPGGTTADFDSNPIPPNDTSRLTITPTLATTPDTYDLAIIAVANLKQKDTTHITLIVQEMTDVDDEGDQLITPDKFALFQNQPNPFNPETEISYYLSEACEVRLTIYNILGRRVKTLFEDYQTPGMKTLVWDGRDDRGAQLGSGVYFYRLQAGEFNQTRKMTLIK